MLTLLLHGAKHKACLEGGSMQVCMEGLARSWCAQVGWLAGFRPKACEPWLESTSRGSRQPMQGFWKHA